VPRRKRFYRLYTSIRPSSCPGRVAIYSEWGHHYKYGGGYAYRVRARSIKEAYYLVGNEIFAKRDGRRRGVGVVRIEKLRQWGSAHGPVVACALRLPKEVPSDGWPRPPITYAERKRRKERQRA